jgi:hypothetical protein
MRLLAVAGSMVLLLQAGSARADVEFNGITMNGITMNGITMNGITMNGITMNGITMNGITMNGITMNGITMNGTALTGTLVDASPSTCAHSEAATGAPLATGCNQCATIVCGADAHCCGNAWDQTCVNEAAARCALGPQNFVGSTMVANAIQPDGTTQSVQLQIQSVQLPPYYVAINCHWVHGTSICTYVNEPTRGPNADVNLYQVNWAGVVMSPLGWRTEWFPICTDPNGPAWDTPWVDHDGLSNMATIVGGAWETRVSTYGHPFTGGGQSWTGGSQIPGTQTTAFTFACRDLGATAKCEERLGYKPWAPPAGVSADTMNKELQSCVRMIRADYCGDGNYHTVSGTEIDVRDSLSLQGYDMYAETSYAGSAGFGFEAVWTPNGSAGISYPRFLGSDPSHPGNSTIADLEGECPGLFAAEFASLSIPPLPDPYVYDYPNAAANTIYTGLNGVWTANRSSTIPGSN